MVERMSRMKQSALAASLLALLLVPAAARAGERARAAQAGLTEAGFQTGKVDGLYGPLTRGAILEFQQTNGMQPTGVLDPKTIAALAAMINVIRAGQGADVVDAAPIASIDESLDREPVIELYSAATSDRPSIRIAAVEILGELRTERAGAALGVVLYTDSNPEIRILAARKLGSYHDAEALRILAVAHDLERESVVRDVIAEEIAKNLPLTIALAS